MRILLAEDDQLTRLALVEVLRKEGFEVSAASDGKEALQLFTARSFDFVCLDIMMPHCNGYDVCRHIRKINPDVPVLFISAKSEEIDKVLGLELGADDFVVKPFGIQEVLARIRAILRRTRMLGKNKELCGEFEIGDLRVVPEELRAYREGASEEISLSLRDIKILRLLAGRRGRVVDRDTLFDIAWGMDYLPNSRTLDQHISQLRKKIERDASSPRIIRTVHGVGYRYDA